MLVDVIIGSAILINREQLAQASHGIERHIIGGLTFPNPDFRRGRSPYGTPEFLKEYRVVGERGEWIRLQRGSLKFLREAFRAFGVKERFDVSGVFSGVTRPPKDPLEVDPQLRDYQLSAAKKLISARQGIASIPTGGGKTRTLSASVLATMEPAIVFCHTADIFDQGVQRFGELGKTARRIRGGGSDFSKLRAGEIAVAMVPTVAGNKWKAGDLLSSAGAVVFDEAHHVPAASWKGIAEHLPAKYRWGCTATPAKGDSRSAILTHLMGPIVFEIGRKTLIEQGYLQAPKIVPVDSGWGPTLCHYSLIVVCGECGKKLNTTHEKLTNSKARCSNRTCRKIADPNSEFRVDTLNYTAAQTGAAQSPAVTNCAVRLAQEGAENGRTVLVLVPRASLVGGLVGRLRALGVPAVGVCGGTPKKERQQAIESVRMRNVSVLVATTLADEGLDIGQLDMAVSMMSGRAKGKALQRMGRIVRLGGNSPIFFDLVNRGAEFSRQWAHRRQAFRSTFGYHSVAYDTPVSVGKAVKTLY